MTATYAQTITRTVRTVRAAIVERAENLDTMSRVTANMAYQAQDEVIAMAHTVGISTIDAMNDFWDEMYAPAVYVPQVGDVVVFHGDKAGHVSGSGGVGPYPVWSDDTRDEPYTMFWLHAHEMTPVFG